MTQRARHKNRIQSLLGRLLLHPPCKSLWTRAGNEWLKQLDLPRTERFIVDSEQRQLQGVERELAALDKQLVALAANEPRVQLLMTLPGVSHVVAIGLLAALGDIDRFPDGDHAAAYLGLVPITRQSGNHCYHGHITKRGNSQARWLLTQSCQHVARHPGPLGAFFRRLLKRKNRQVAIMAVARKLVTIAYLMLKNNEPYRYAKPKLVATKLAVLRRRATASVQFVPLSKAGGHGLSAIYSAAGLPRVTLPEALPKGERRMLNERKLDEFVTGLYASSPSKPKNRETRGGPAGRPQ